MIYTDNKQLAKDIYSDCEITAFGSSEGVAAIIEIREILQSMQIKATIRHTNSYPKIKKPFIKDPEPWLITQYHNQANRIRMKVQ